MSRPRSYFARDESRPAPTPARMAEILASHAGASLMSGAGSEHHPERTMSTGGGAITAGDLRAGAVLPHATGTLQDQQEALQKLTDAPPLQYGPEGPPGPIKPITAVPVMLQGHSPAPPVLEWLKPCYFADGSGVILSSGKTYSVAKERSGDTWRYVAFHGINALGASKTAVDAQGKCTLHFLEAAGA